MAVRFEARSEQIQDRKYTFMTAQTGMGDEVLSNHITEEIQAKITFIEEHNFTASCRRVAKFEESVKNQASIPVKLTQPSDTNVIS